jgi:membrane protein
MSFTIFKSAVASWLRHRSARMGAALAYYSVFSIGPLLLIVMSVAGLLFGADAVQGHLASQFRSLMGPIGSQAVEAMLADASSPTSGRLAAITGAVLLIVAALGVVAQLKDAMNTIWDVAEPEDVSVWWYVRTYLVSLAGILGLGFLLAVSMVISMAVAVLSSWVGPSMGALAAATDFIFGLVVLTLLFAMLFKWLPDAEIAWRDVVPSALVTALLFWIGKSGIGWYVGTLGLESSYGAAASLIVLLIWVYYSAQIVLFGAELTHAYAQERGSRRSAAVVPT